MLIMMILKLTALRKILGIGRLQPPTAMLGKYPTLKFQDNFEKIQSSNTYLVLSKDLIFLS